jgi:hypothetical protein
MIVGGVLSMVAGWFLVSMDAKMVRTRFGFEMDTTIAFLHRLVPQPAWTRRDVRVHAIYQLGKYLGLLLFVSGGVAIVLAFAI